MTLHKITVSLIACFKKGKTAYFIGNGGSSTQSSHFAAEFVCKYKKVRRPLPAVSLTDPAVITSIGNDFGFIDVFSRQVEALGRKGDVLVALSTSGKSPNILKAIGVAKDKGMTVIDFPRRGQGSGEVQNYQVSLMHQICEEVENYFV